MNLQAAHRVTVVCHRGVNKKYKKLGKNTKKNHNVSIMNKLINLNKVFNIRKENWTANKYPSKNLSG